MAETAVPAQLTMAGPSPLDAAGFTQPSTVSWSQGAWQVVGEDSQALMVLLNNGEEVMCEPGGMLHSAPGLKPEADMGGIGMGFQRCCCAGESCIRVHYMNQTGQPQSVSITPSFPAKVVPIDMSKYSGLIIKKQSFTASIGREVEIGIQCVPSWGVGCCAEQGCCMSTLNGTGTAFLNAGGAVFMKNLAAGEQVHCDSSSVVAVEKTVTWDIIRTGDCLFMMCGGMGCFNTLLTGPGLVILQSMSIERTIKGFMAHAQSG
uniref:Uncharacterized protein n=1 Tax=Hemiselmis andersenii TaxID=464988 RepID=A0A6T8H4C9_HEMAN|mmetsp:Transcript_4350/g.9937  ORF Transcript_4350/g.9937 Transcript_4350/m.9937 type:complete len:261 (-) Transcript_4350:318-1100(-)